MSKLLAATSFSQNAISIQVLLDKRPTAKRLILSVLSQPNMSCLPIAQLIAWGALFDQTPAAIRVTAGRLVANSLLEKTGRGLYTIGPEGLALKSKANEWTTALNRTRHWEGGWFVVHTAHLGKSLRAKVRARERAFRLLGFEELVSGLWVRPDNLSYSTLELHAKICKFGLEFQAIVMKSNDLIENNTESTLALWSVEALNANYGQMIELLNQSQRRLNGQDLYRVIRETFIVGEYVIRQINADPLLPSEYIDAAQRQEMIHAMMRYSTFSHPYWAEFLNGGNERNSG